MIAALLLFRVCIPALAWMGKLPWSARWGARWVVIDLVLAAWFCYAWAVTRGWYLKWLAVLFPMAAGAGAAWSWGYRSMGIAIAGSAIMLLAMLLGLRLIRVALSPGVAALGVAGTVLEEAIRMKVVLAAVVGLLLLVPFLPLMLDPKELLKYRIQFFLHWGLSSAAVFLSLMTIFLATGTVCNEIRGRQIHLTLTKPIGRVGYLMGKWLGVALLNLLLVGVVGIGLYAFTQVLRQQPEVDAQDRAAIEHQILVARQAVAPQPPQQMNLAALFEKRLKQLQAEAPNRYAGQGPDAMARRAIQQALAAQWHTIAPRDAQRYVFTGLLPAKRLTESVQLRLKPMSSITPPDQRVKLALWLNGRPFPVDPKTANHAPIVLADNRFHVVDLPAETIDSSGRLEVRIANVDLINMRATFPSSIAFTPREGITLLYPVGRFGPNLVRGLTLIWFQLCFLAMLGIAAGALFSFPVACLVSGLVFVAAGASGFLLESLNQYVGFPAQELSGWATLVWAPKQLVKLVQAGEAWQAVKILLWVLGRGFVAIIPSLSDYQPASWIADGRVVRLGLVGWAGLRVGLNWTGVCALGGWVVFRHRELARVTV